MTSKTDALRRMVDQFCTDLTILVRAQLLQEVEERLLASAQPAPPPTPRRRPVYRSVNGALPAPPSDSLTPAEQQALTALKTAGYPLRSWDLAARLSKAESTIRFQLKCLVRKHAAKQVMVSGYLSYEPA